MNNQTQQTIAYATNALTFIFLKENISKYIQNIYLFGSSIRGELTKESDIDIFIDCNKEFEQEVEKNCKSALSIFYNSKDYEKWKSYEFIYPLSIQIGEVKTWELYSSILADGILLYSRKIAIETTERKVLFMIELPKNKKKYLFLTRKLFGRKEHGYKDNGIIMEIKGNKLSSTIFIIPKEDIQKITELLNKEKIEYSMKEVAVFD
ncbi:nucleotidyltransferase domain-containing protein [Candidatus Woesearchaeota archaeon]|nr:nucleotidyltransferase domain-containing protein [Candidatus Woesearchaeota archaeon]